MDGAAIIEKWQIFHHRCLVLGMCTAQHAKSIAELMMQSLVIIALDIYAEDSYKNITARYNPKM